jgi:TonB-linked SusC/RagA family outer membrane protein
MNLKINRFHQAGLFIIILCGLLGINSSLSAQNSKVSGQVIDAQTQKPLPGVNILVVGTSTGAATNSDGDYSLTVPSMQDTLRFTFIGYETQRIPINGQHTINVTLQPTTITGNQLVVTALGVKKESKSLGYSTQEVENKSLVKAHEPNLTNALSGKVAGLQVIQSSNGPGGSSKIVLRGFSSLTGDNQPLIVVDGVPIDNSTGMTNNDFFNPSLDRGNGLADIDPDDIKSLQVLKGPSAAALYGSRAGNGVILITTKTGTKQEGLGITVSSTDGFSSLFMKPDLQNAFGQGSDGVFDPKSDLSWGPEVKGQEVENWNDKKVNLHTYDNIDNYQRTGVTNKQNISFSQGYKNTTIYASLSRLNDLGITRGQKYTRLNLNARTHSTFGSDDRWTLDTKLLYINSKRRNRPQGGVNVSNVFYTMYMLPRSLDIRNFNPPTDKFDNMIWYAPTSSVNPYWAAKYRRNAQDKNRYIMDASLQYDFTDWLSAKVQAAGDIYNTNTDSRVFAGSPIVDNGQLSLGKKNYSETNYKARITAEKDNLFGKFGGKVFVGGNLMNRKITTLDANSGSLEVPNLFTLNNGKNDPTVSHGETTMRINSLYGSLELNWDQYIFLNATYRNDWSSTLSSENRSFSYPSVSLSYVLTSMLDNIPDWLSYAKIRGSYAAVGNSLPPYQLFNTYKIGKDPNGNTTAYKNSTLFNSNVKSELIKSYEAGFNVKFLENRVGLDFTWYRSNATRQLINIPMDPLSGYGSKKINAGNIQNTGIEVVFNTDLIRNAGSFNWNLQANFSRNKDLVKALTPGVSNFVLGGYDNVQIMATAGKEYGEIYGTKFKRVEDKDSPHYGELLLDGNGLPQEDPDRVLLGNQQPNFLLGLTNSFSYKGLNLSFMINGRFGGQMFSSTMAFMEAVGTASVTAPGGKRKDFVLPGVIAVKDENETGYEENTHKITQQQYWQAVQTGNIGVTEANLYDATNIRLKNIHLSYTLPNSLFSNTMIRNINLGFTYNNVWMISSYMHGIDPESVFATGTNAVGFENSSPPTTRQILFNVSFKF